MSTPQFIKLETREGVGFVTLNRPPVNAINRGLLDELHAAAGTLARDASVKAVVLSGEGKNFAAGADIKEIAALQEGDGVAAFSRAGMEAFLALERLDKPVIAAVRGFCLGGGCELAMAAHIRIADSTAKFGQPEIKLGICPGFAGSQRLCALVGRPNAQRLLLTGEPIDAAEAHRIGLAQVLVPEGADVLEEATKMARGIAQYSSLVIARVMRLTTAHHPSASAEGMELESAWFGELSRTHDMKEGFAAFIAKRKAEFKDR